MPLGTGFENEIVKIEPVTSTTPVTHDGVSGLRVKATVPCAPDTVSVPSTSLTSEATRIATPSTPVDCAKTIVLLVLLAKFDCSVRGILNPYDKLVETVDEVSVMTPPKNGFVETVRCSAEIMVNWAAPLLW
ncbi:Uncharacterised protein [uncultured archaeon]|nr:Uncharacterised protein [uncultured archaeon]